MASFNPDPALAWRVERACFAAWPPRAVHRVDAWRIALSGGGTRRINSASAAAPGPPPDPRAIEPIFAAAGQPLIVRVTDLVPGLDASLDAAGFAAPEGRTRTLCRPPTGGATSTAIVHDRPDAEWLAARRQLSLAVGAGADDHISPALRTAAHTVFVRVAQGNATCSLGFAALTEGIAVVEAVATDPATRGRGHARTVVTALLDWAARVGADAVALQVEETNAPARALYAALGFATDLYGYHYRRRATCPTSA